MSVLSVLKFRAVNGIISSFYMSGFYYYINYVVLLLLLFVLYFVYITFYYTPNSSKKSVFCKLDMMRLLFCVLTNVLSFVCIICVLSCYNKLLYFCWKLSNHYFHVKYSVVHFKYFSGAIFRE